MTIYNISNEIGTHLWVNIFFRARKRNREQPKKYTIIVIKVLCVNVSNAYGMENGKRKIQS